MNSIFEKGTGILLSIVQRTGPSLFAMSEGIPQKFLTKGFRLMMTTGFNS
jgi:hypothetical protein